MLTTATARDIPIYPGAIYGYGGSSSPDTVFVEAVDEKWVTFRRFPYIVTQREQISVFRVLAITGTRYELANCERVAATYPSATWATEHAEHFRALLSGQTGRTWDVDDFRKVGLVVLYHGTGDGWSEWERHYPHSVCGSDTEARELTIYDFSANKAESIRRRLDAGEFPGFSFGRITDYHRAGL